MKNIYIISIIVLLGACEAKDFQFVLPLNEEIAFLINEDEGNFEESRTVTRADVMDNISGLEGDVVIQRLDIESVALKPKNAPAGLNGFKNLNVTILFNGITTPVFQDQEVSFSTNQNEIIVTNLVIQGVNRVRDVLEGYVIGNNFEPFTIIASGNSVPDNVPVQMELILDIKFSIVFTRELEAPFFMGD